MNLREISSRWFATAVWWLAPAFFACHPASGAPVEFLFAGATVHCVAGDTLSPGAVLVRDGKIVAVGRTVPAGNAQVIKLDGLHLYPGLIALNSLLGLTEIEAVRATADSTEVGDYTPDVESWIAVNPDSELVPVTRANGIAFFESVPQGGIVSGQSGLMCVDGWTTEQMTFKKPVALHVFWPKAELDTAPKPGDPKQKKKSLEEQGRERTLKLQGLADFFEEAKAYAAAKRAAVAGKAPAPQVVPAWEAMIPYATGERPVMVHADDIRQIRAAVSWAATNHIQIILAGARDAFMAADLLATNHVPVIYSHTYTQPSHDTEPYDVHFSAAGVLARAGVKVSFSVVPNAFNAPLTFNLPYEAAQAVAFGLPADEALKGLTLYPAQLAGVADRLGSIAPGLDATLFVADGDILDIRSRVRRMWIAGQEISLENRQTRLYQKYKNRPAEK